MDQLVENSMTELPFLSGDVAPIAAAIKRRYEDFRVEEIPAYPLAGVGDHIYFVMEKEGLATMRAVNDIARVLGIHTRDIGLAGLKDARAITKQWMSIEHIDPAKIEALRIPRIKISNITRHRNKLKIGHLRGNHFDIKMRDVDLARIDDIRAICNLMWTRGVPNYFGQQRFGLRGDTWQIGRAILQRDHETAVNLVLGRPGPSDHGPILKARRLYEVGNFSAAAKAWPFGFRDHARACRAMEQSHGKHARAFHALDQRLKKLFVNAFQSYLFNKVLAERIGELDQIHEGDLAYKHENGSVFRVTNVSADAPRAAAFEISATGPLYGFRMTTPEGPAAELESSVLAAEGFTLEQFRNVGTMKLHGARRPLRFRPENTSVEPGTDENGAYIRLCFSLPPGCYATMILREVCKNALEEGLEEVED